MSRLFCLEGDVLQECGELLGDCLTCEELVGVTWRLSDCEELVGAKLQFQVNLCHHDLVNIIIK